MFTKLFKKANTMLPDGTLVYFVPSDKMHKLPVQKILNIQEALNYISLIGVDKHTHKEAISRIKTNIITYIDSKDTNKLLDALTYLDHINSNLDTHTSTISSVNAMVFDLFYYLDGEDPYKYSESTLNKKKELITKYPMECVFFFQKKEVEEIIKNYGLTLNGAIQISALQSALIRELKDINQSNQTNTQSE